VSEDIDLFFTTVLGSTATIVSGTSTVSAAVYFDEPSQSALNGAVMVDDPSITYPTRLGLARGDSVTVDGTAYTVRSVEKLDDGLISRAVLQA
jgi:hypothetical protein